MDWMEWMEWMDWMDRLIGKKEKRMMWSDAGRPNPSRVGAECCSRSVRSMEASYELDPEFGSPNILVQSSNGYQNQWYPSHINILVVQY